MREVLKYNPVDSLVPVIYPVQLTVSGTNVDDFARKFIPMKIISLYKCASLQKQTETAIKI